MSSHAADERLDLVRSDMSLGLRMSAVVLVPAALGLFALARPLAVTLFAHHATTVADATRIGAALAAFAAAVLPFSAFQLQLRAFYAMADSRTPAFVMCGVAVVNIVSGLVLANVLPDRQRAVALALSFALAYAFGAAVCFRLLRRRLGGVDGPRIGRTVVRAAVGGGIAAAIAYAISTVLRSAVGHGVFGSLLGVLAGALVGGAFYLFAAWRMTEELPAVVSLIGGRVRR
jgi:putative peptidoglycan lipid II flippase